MLLSSRAMCHMMDVLPSSPAALVHYDAVPLFCERLLSIEYIDLAEQALQALEKLSHEHPLAILRAGGMLAVLQYVDFFATGVQRIAVSTAANLCRGLPTECAHLVSDAIPQLTGLLNHHDQKVLEHVCLAFARLVDDFAHAPPKLEMLASHGLLNNLLHLISSMIAGGSALDEQPSSEVSLPTPTYTMLLRTLATLCRGSPSLSHQLLQQQVAYKLREVLLTDESLAAGVNGTSGGGGSSGVGVARPVDQLHQILSLCNELLPPLPKQAAGGVLASPSASRHHHSVSKRRSRRGGDEDDVEQSAAAISEREKSLAEEPGLLVGYSNALFPVLLQVHSATANAAVRQKVLSCVCKVVHFSTAESLEELLRELPFASFIAALLASQEAHHGLMGLFCAELLFEKLPHIYADKFLREGVFHAVTAICNTKPPEPPAAAQPTITGSSVTTTSAAQPPAAAANAPAPGTASAGGSTSPSRRPSRSSAAAAAAAAAQPPPEPPAAAAPAPCRVGCGLQVACAPAIARRQRLASSRLLVLLLCRRRCCCGGEQRRDPLVSRDQIPREVCERQPCALRRDDGGLCDALEAQDAGEQDARSDLVLDAQPVGEPLSRASALARGYRGHLAIWAATQRARRHLLLRVGAERSRRGAFRVPHRRGWRHRRDGLNRLEPDVAVRCRQGPQGRWLGRHGASHLPPTCILPHLPRRARTAAAADCCRHAVYWQESDAIGLARGATACTTRGGGASECRRWWREAPWPPCLEASRGAKHDRALPLTSYRG